VFRYPHGKVLWGWELESSEDCSLKLAALRFVEGVLLEYAGTPILPARSLEATLVDTAPLISVVVAQ
jgi:hypothetical protein